MKQYEFSYLPPSNWSKEGKTCFIKLRKKDQLKILGVYEDYKAQTKGALDLLFATLLQNL